MSLCSLISIIVYTFCIDQICILNAPENVVICAIIGFVLILVAGIIASCILEKKIIKGDG